MKMLVGFYMLSSLYENNIKVFTFIKFSLIFISAEEMLENMHSLKALFAPANLFSFRVHLNDRSFNKCLFIITRYQKFPEDATRYAKYVIFSPFPFNT